MCNNNSMLSVEILYHLPATKIQDESMLPDDLDQLFKPLNIHLSITENILQC